MITPNVYSRNRRYSHTVIVLFAVLMAGGWTANAQAPTDSSSPETPFPLSVKEVRVNGESAGINDKIIVVVNNLDEELKRQQDPESGVLEQERIDPHKFVLFLDKMEMKKLYPFAVAPKGELHFRLTRNSDSRDAWLNFLAHPKDSSVQVEASVGPEGKTPLEGKPFTLRLYNQKLLYFGAVLFIVTLIGFVIAGKTTTIIRDSGPPSPTGGPLTRPYSLARAQMAWWFFIILGSFLFIALVTWDLDTITSSSLILLGIGAGTALGAAMVDANKRESSHNDLRTLKPQEAKLAALVGELKGKIHDAETKLAAGGDQANIAASLAALRTELATREAEWEQIKLQLDDALSGLEKPISEGLIIDFLSDVNGVTFHRFQIVVWTIVLGLIFIYSVWKNLTMPQFSDTLLALMGISAGTYIGFKIPERQTQAGDDNANGSDAGAGNANAANAGAANADAANAGAANAGAANAAANAGAVNTGAVSAANTGGADAGAANSSDANADPAAAENAGGDDNLGSSANTTAPEDEEP